MNPEEQRERQILSEIVLPALESEKPLREVELDPDDEKRLRGFQLLSAKPMLIVINADESRAADAPEAFGIEPRPAVRAVTVSAPIEQEISTLSPEEQKDFLADLGLSEPSLDRVTRASYDLLGVISFFTVGEDEVRAWTIRRGTRAREAAGAIHSDIERGFIRAEVVHCDDLIRLKTMAACRDAGLLRLEGKEYVDEGRRRDPLPLQRLAENKRQRTLESRCPSGPLFRPTAAPTRQERSGSAVPCSGCPGGSRRLRAAG